MRSELPHKSKTAEPVCSAAHCANCCPIEQLQLSAVRRRCLHVRHREIRHHRHFDVHRQAIHRRLELSAKLVHAKPWHGKVRLAMSEEHCYAPLRHDLRSVARRRNEIPLRCRETVRRRVLGRCWRDRTRAQVRRGSSLRLLSQSDGCPSRGYSPSRPRAPCQGRCRYRNTPARSSHWARRRTEHSRSSRTRSLVERRC